MPPLLGLMTSDGRCPCGGSGLLNLAPLIRRAHAAGGAHTRRSRLRTRPSCFRTEDFRTERSRTEGFSYSPPQPFSYSPSSGSNSKASGRRLNLVTMISSRTRSATFLAARCHDDPDSKCSTDQRWYRRNAAATSTYQSCHSLARHVGRFARAFTVSSREREPYPAIPPPAKGGRVRGGRIGLPPARHQDRDAIGNLLAEPRFLGLVEDGLSQLGSQVLGPSEPEPSVLASCLPTLSVWPSRQTVRIADLVSVTHELTMI